MHKRFATAAVLAAAVCAFWAARSSSAAQQASEGGARRMPAEIVLPQELETEKPATLAVIGTDGRLEPDVNVSLSIGRQVRTDTTGRARFVTPTEAGVLVAEIAGTDVRASALILPPSANASATLSVRNYPRVAAESDRIEIRGAGFRGDVDENIATLGNHDALVVAASPNALVIQAGPGTSLGPTNLTVQVAGNKSGPLPITLVSIEIQRPGEELAPGKKGQAFIYVGGTEDRIALALRNLSPGVVTMRNGNFQHLVSSGGRTNAAVTSFVALSAGPFSLSARVIPPPSGAPDMDFVLHELQAARAVAPGDWKSRVEAAVRQAEAAARDKRQAAELQSALELMLASGAQGDLGRHLEAAWAALLRP
jgi:hypothetical protein